MKILGIIEEAETDGKVSDLDTILGDLTTELGVDDSYVDWLLKVRG